MVPTLCHTLINYWNYTKITSFISEWRQGAGDGTADVAEVRFIELGVGSRPCSEGAVISGYPPSTKTNTSKFQFVEKARTHKPQTQPRINKGNLLN